MRDSLFILNPVKGLYQLVQRPWAYAFVSVLLVCSLVSVVAWQAALGVDRDRDLPLIQSLGAYVSTLEGGTSNSQAMGAAILFGMENSQAHQLVSGKLSPDDAVVVAALDSLRRQFIAESVIIVDKQGVVLASSSQSGAKMTGRNLFHQPCVRLAIQGAASVYPAVNEATNRPGIYLAAPLRSRIDNSSSPIGAVVLEVGYDKLSLLLKGWTNGVAVLLSPQGVVFASSRDDWSFHVTNKANPDQDKKHPQFGQKLELTHPLPFSVDAEMADFGGAHYVIRGHTLDWNDPLGDWQLLLLDLRAPWWTQWNVLSISGLAGLLLALSLIWVFNLVRNALLLKGMYVQLRQSDEALREREQMLLETQNIAGLGTYNFDFSTGLFAVSEVTYKLFGIPHSYDHTLPGWLALVHPDDRNTLAHDLKGEALAHGGMLDSEYRIIRYNDQALRWMHGLGRLKYDEQGNPVQLVGTIQDITERKQAEIEIKSLAFYDQLTGLPNRRMLRDRLKHTLTLCEREGLSGALLFIDMDNFKFLNDTLGHDIGDLLLKQVSSRLESCVREGDTVARLGGDEFVIMLDDLHLAPLEAASQAEAVGEKILSVLGQTYLLSVHECHSTPSIGIALFNGTNRSMDELLKQADIAMYQAKKAGRNTMRFYDPEMQAVMVKRIELECDLRRAIAEPTQLLLHYQSQVDEKSRQIGAEVLVRWQHPERGLLTSDVFIALAEESGLILPLGQWVLASACQQLQCWAANPVMAHLTLSVNISAKQFNQPAFVDSVCALMGRFDIGYGKLKMEITESLLLSHVPDVIVKITRLQALGIGFAMDDFGTGYSSLQYLKQLPLDQIKIDQSFVRDLVGNASDRAIVRTIIAVSHSLKLNVIAEGVETEAQREVLRAEGCLCYQGYLFGKPMSIEQFELMAVSGVRPA